MLLLLILPLLISGYCVQKWNYKHRYQLHRYTGQLLYLKSAYLGAICLIFSFIFSSILLSLKPFQIFGITIGFDLLGSLTKLLNNTLKIERKSLPFYMMLTVGSFLIAWIWSYGENIIKILWFNKVFSIPFKFIMKIILFWKNFKIKIAFTILSLINLSLIEISKENLSVFIKKIFKWYEDAKLDYIYIIKIRTFSENPLDELLLDSFTTQQDLMLHMDDRKVYIGFVMTLSEATESDSLAQEIAIFPLKSGYRDKDNLTVKITTQYKEKDGLFLILRRSEIISATTYDPNIFQGFMDKQKQENQTFFEKVTTKIPSLLKRPSIDNPTQQS